MEKIAQFINDPAAVSSPQKADSKLNGIKSV
jgi:hypothetical protein